MSYTKPVTPIPEPSRDEIQREALAWAEFLYDEYMFNKHKQLLLDSDDSKMETDKGVTSE